MLKSKTSTSVALFLQTAGQAASQKLKYDMFFQASVGVGGVFKNPKFITRSTAVQVVGPTLLFRHLQWQEAFSAFMRCVPGKTEGHGNGTIKNKLTDARSETLFMSLGLLSVKGNR